MLAILAKEYDELHCKGGRKRKLSVLDMTVLTLGYLHEYEFQLFDFETLYREQGIEMRIAITAWHPGSLSGKSPSVRN